MEKIMILSQQRIETLKAINISQEQNNEKIISLEC